ncbi:hypothetical protein FMM75_16180 [Lachnospiraceae bacterium MD335]|nr:hypothetical protein [Lachnospiraceae bacterium MD335]
MSRTMRRRVMFRNAYGKRITAAFLTAALVLGMLPPNSVRAAQPETAETASEQAATEETVEDVITYEIIEIHTAEDLLALADNCYVDEWSKNKSVVLKADIDLSQAEDFFAVPVFGGIFDGEGHTISGFDHTGAGYVTGLFRYIESSGLVKNLTLKGNIEGDDEEECIGGLCGVNYGTINNCTFRGTVKGRDTVGGLVGINESSATVLNCTAKGRILGNYSTGGIVGINHGVINHCTNEAGINDNTEWVEEDDELGTGIFLSISVDDEKTEIYSGVDAGGIAGYSDGMISRCTNSGTVGYEHSGYNIGGIAGRQAGLVSLCTNAGEVYGRKDVGGIVGQMEPYIEVNEAESLRSAINKLHDLIDDTLDDIKSTKDVLKKDVDSLQDHAGKAVDTGDALVTQLTDFVDGNLDQVNAFADRMDYVIDMFPNITDNVSAALDELSHLNGIIDDLKDDLNITSDAYKPTQYTRISLVTTVGGRLSCDKTEPAQGETVTVTVRPGQDYRMKEKGFAVKDKNGKKIAFTDAGSGVFTFEMPKNNVLVTAEFEHTGIFASSGVGGLHTIDGAAGDAVQTESETLKEDAAEETAAEETVQEQTPQEDTEDSNVSFGNGEDITETKNQEETSQTPQDNTEEAADVTSENVPGAFSDIASDEASDTENSESAVSSAQESSNRAESETERSEAESSSESGGQVTTALIKLSSNLGGTASYTCNADGVVTLTITPYEGYELSANPTVKDSKNKTVSVSKRKANGTVYAFNISKSVQPCTVKISFKKQNKGQAAEGALEDVSDCAKELSEAVNGVKESIDKIKSIIQNSDGSMKRWSELTDAEKEAVKTEVLKLSASLSDISASGAGALSALSSLANVLSTYDLAGAADDAGRDIDRATDCLQKVVNSFKAASNTVRDIINYLNAQPDIEFSKLGDGFDATKEDLHDQLKGISDSLSSLSDNASVYSDLVNDDLRKVNDQLNVVFNLLADTMTDLNELDLDKYYEDDIDDEALVQLTTGKTDICTNKGIVRGDINVGGIAGSMSIDSEDLEGNAAGSVDFELGSKFITRCAIMGSVNEGYVTAKKNGAGGIVGYMNHGVVVDSEGYGSVESTEGDYVGGICGESHTIIKRCYSLCSVAGTKNIGGIAGYAETLKNCYAMSKIASENGRMGAIAGQINGYEDIEEGEEEIKVSGNYYVGDDIYGIDNISYTGVAEPVTYRELLTVENLPREFWHLKVIYKIEDTYLGEEEVKYGEPLNALHYPQIPEKSGCYGVWEDVTDQTMTGTLLVEAQYRDNVTVVQSSDGETMNEGSAKKPYALVNEAFTENTVLNAVVNNQIAPPERAAHKDYVIYEVSLENSRIGATDSFAVRLLNPYDKAQVWEYRDGVWTKLESKVRGQYLQVDMVGTDSVFCLVSDEKNMLFIIGGIAAGAAALMVAAVILKGGMKRGGRRRKSAAGKEE